MLQHRLFRLTLVLLLLVPAVFAQGPETYTARLGWVPISGAERDDVTGSGTATVNLSGSRLAIRGHVEGLPAAATVARLHQGVATGARGPAIADLAISHGMDSDISGDIALSPAQLDALRAGHLYIQVHAERGVAPDNTVLWGWIINDRFLQNKN